MRNRLLFGITLLMSLLAVGVILRPLSAQGQETSTETPTIESPTETLVPPTETLVPATETPTLTATSTETPLPSEMPTLTVTETPTPTAALTEEQKREALTEAVQIAMALRLGADYTSDMLITTAEVNMVHEWA